MTHLLTALRARLATGYYADHDEIRQLLALVDAQRAVVEAAQLSYISALPEQEAQGWVLVRLKHLEKLDDALTDLEAVETSQP